MPEDFVLRDMLRDGLSSINTRLDEHRELATERHSEVSRRLLSVESEMRDMSTATTQHREQLTALRTSAAQDATKAQSGQAQEQVTLTRLKWYIACFSAGAAVAVWAITHFSK